MPSEPTHHHEMPSEPTHHHEMPTPGEPERATGTDGVTCGVKTLIVCMTWQDGSVCIEDGSKTAECFPTTTSLPHVEYRLSPTGPSKPVCAPGSSIKERQIATLRRLNKKFVKVEGGRARYYPSGQLECFMTDAYIKMMHEQVD